MVPSPGRWPAATSLSMRGARSANTASATGPPGMIFACPVPTRSVSPRLVQEVPFAGQHHRDPELVGARDVRIVAHGASGLDDHGDPGVGRRLDAVREREERVARARAALRTSRGLLRRDLAGLDAVLLARADADRLATLHEHDRVRLRS